MGTLASRLLTSPFRSALNGLLPGIKILHLKFKTYYSYHSIKLRLWLTQERMPPKCPTNYCDT